MGREEREAVGAEQCPAVMLDPGCISPSLTLAFFLICGLLFQSLPLKSNEKPFRAHLSFRPERLVLIFIHKPRCSKYKGEKGPETNLAYFQLVSNMVSLQLAFFPL